MAADRIAATYKLDPETKQRVDVMADALGMEKSQVIKEAVEQMATTRYREVKRYLDQANQSFRTAQAR